MEEQFAVNDKLDVEFKRYLQIIRPYVGQLVDQDVVDLCNAWISRLSQCGRDERILRNKYIFVLCYQLARGILDEPFVKNPPEDELPPILEIPDSDTSTEIEYVVVDEENLEENSSKMLFNSKKAMTSETDIVSLNHEYDDINTPSSSKDFRDKQSEEQISNPSRKQTILCYTCPQLMQACSKDVQGDHYEFRANNLIKRLREIKRENMLLHNELLELKEESKTKANDFSLSSTKIDHTLKSNNKESITNLTILKSKLQELQGIRTNLLDTVANLQEQLDNIDEMKKIEIEDLKAKHKMEIAKIRASLRGESKDIYQDKLDELKKHYEGVIANLETRHDATKIEKLKKDYEERLKQKDRSIEELTVEKDKIIQAKEAEIVEKDKIIQAKETEIVSLKTQVEDQKKNIESLLIKLAEKPNEELNNDSIKLKAQELEKRLYKLEKSKMKSAKMYENKLQYLQREKHLTECSLQLQLVRQRAQVVNKVADENQGDLNTALEKLESKYKDIVANVQSTAIQRRLQDQMALEAILQAAFQPRHDMYNNTSNQTNQSQQIPGRTVTVKHKNPDRSFDSDFSGEFLFIPPIKLIRHKDTISWDVKIEEVVPRNVHM